ncbi:MAG: permease-like cell division protein FtsX [Myxococcota bacterium]|nr:permease-like cell division protein FtsX [Myxococcota bacterium]
MITRHIIRRSIRSLRENLYLNAVACGVIIVSLFLLGLYVSIQNNITQLIDTWNKDVHISAYFESTTTENERFIIRERIHELPEATQVKYVSEKEAQEWFISRVDGIEETLSALGDGILPSSLEITLSGSVAGDPAKIESFAKKINGPEFSNLDYGIEWVERFNTFLNMLQALGMLLGAIILLSAMFLVTNTVHLVVYSRKNELEIAKLVGASDRFVLVPFLFEGFLQGLTGGCVALFLLYWLHQLVTLRLETVLDLRLLSDLVFLSPIHMLTLVLIGIFLGLSSGFIATQRFLRTAP